MLDYKMDVQQSAFKIPIPKKKSVKRIIHHHKRSPSYQRFYKDRKRRMSSTHTRKLPIPDQLGILPYDISDFLHKSCDSNPMYASTKFCKRFYTGCTDPYCTFAHSNAVARWTPAHAKEDISFYKPPGSLNHGFLRVPVKYKPFIVNLEDSDDEHPRPSISLSAFSDENDRWLARQNQLAHDKWFNRSVKEYETKKKELQQKLMKLKK